jgi:hypothetical protein
MPWLIRGAGAPSRSGRIAANAGEMLYFLDT